MRPLFRASRLERIVLFFRTPLGLAILSISWGLLVVALVSGYMLLILWAMPPKDIRVSSTGASRWENELDGWMARRLLCTPDLPCDAWSPTADGHFRWKLEMQFEEELKQC